MRTLDLLGVSLVFAAKGSVAFGNEASSCPAGHIPLPLAQSGTNVAMPALGFGCWKLSGDVPSLVEAAVVEGWRHFDSATDYGNEAAVGEGLHRAMASGERLGAAPSGWRASGREGQW